MRTITGTCVALLVLASVAQGYSTNPVIKIAAQGMSLLKPIFKLEAELQASALGAIGKVDKQEVIDEIAGLKKQNKALIYTYGLSPFSTEAINILDSSGYEFTKIELGAEWFLLGPKESVVRTILAEEVDNGATSLPKIFIGGECIGGCSELASLVDNGELDSIMSKAKVPKKGGNKKKNAFFG